MAVQQVSYLKVGEHRNHARVWLEGLRLAATGIVPGTKYKRSKVPNRNTLILEPSNDGDYKASRKRKSRGSEDFLPVVDLNNDTVSELFGGFS